ncbi:MAG: TIGR04086 family membrane protein [Firmicutes bacterium]|nr:TIGR04086 family membrane protein [Bacillota bacterium]
MGRRNREAVINPTSKHYTLEIVKAVVVAVILSLASILILAFLIPAINISNEALPIINQVIKGVVILVACLVALRLPKNGWLRGIIVGLVYVLIAFILFSLLAGASFDFGLTLLNDIALGAVTGLLSGIIASLIRKRKA